MCDGFAGVARKTITHNNCKAPQALRLSRRVNLNSYKTVRLGLLALHPAAQRVARFGPFHQRGANVSVFGPHAILVGLAMGPEASALHFAESRSDGSKVGVATALPVHIFKALPLFRGNSRAGIIAQRYKTFFCHNI